ncbi:hypothetical protein [Paenibacillus sp. NPDC057934]|uniref:hypothetical protein n=1 Tax=Paenibacillus sp. NPDC057934 TaxID=3346282 RepID=UPI0036DDCB69
MKDAVNASWTHFAPEEDEPVNSPFSLVEGTPDVNEQELASPGAGDMDDIARMLEQLSPRGLKNAKAILEDVFFTSFDDV